MGELVATKNYLQRHILRGGAPIFVPNGSKGEKVVKEDGKTTPGITFYEAGLILVGREAEISPWFLGTVSEATKISPQLRKIIVQTMLVTEAKRDRG